MGIGVEYVIDPNCIRAHLLDALIQKIKSGEFNNHPESLQTYVTALSEFVDIMLEHLEGQNEGE